MKTKKIQKTLNLSKVTIARLDKSETGEVKGGWGYLTYAACSKPPTCSPCGGSTYARCN